MANDGTAASTFSQLKEKGSFTLSSAEAFGVGTKPDHVWKKKPKSVSVAADLEGLTPEDVHDIRYSGTRLEVICIEDNGDKDPSRLALARHQLANDAAAAAFKSGHYKMMMLQDVGEKLASMPGSFDDLGSEAFVVMHMVKAFLGKRPDYAPIEVTAVRVRLTCGVEKDPYHVFPSPLPIPYGKHADFTSAQKEYHEIEEDSFTRFEDDYVNIFYKLLMTMNPKYPRRNLMGRTPKLPLVVCKAHSVQATAMSFEYLRQRALMAQKDNLPTEAPHDFVVPEKLSMSVCGIDFFDMAFRAILRACRLNCKPDAEVIDESLMNLCIYHKNTNKLNCATYVVCEIVEQLLVFSQYFSGDIPARFVEPYRLHEILENQRMDYCLASVSPLSEGVQEKVRHISGSLVVRGASLQQPESDGEESERGSATNDPSMTQPMESHHHSYSAHSPEPSSGDKHRESQSGPARSMFTSSSSGAGAAAVFPSRVIGPRRFLRRSVEMNESDKEPKPEDLLPGVSEGKGNASVTPSPTPMEDGLPSAAGEGFCADLVDQWFR